MVASLITTDFSSSPSSPTPTARLPKASASAGTKLTDQKRDTEGSNAGRNLKATGTRDVKVLLLGQSGSGKTTLQTNLQIHLSPTTLDSSSHRFAYKPIIYFNIITALNCLVTELDYQLSLPPHYDAEQKPLLSMMKQAREDIQLDKLRMKILPLIALEDFLEREIREGVKFRQVDAVYSADRCLAFVRLGWQERIGPRWNFATNHNWNALDHIPSLFTKNFVLVARDIRTFWDHWITKFYVSKRLVPLDDTAPYFLDHLERIAEVGYCPTNEDILHARVETIGIVESEYELGSISRGIPYKWRVCDVSGVAGQRKAWMPFFEDVSVVIFLAPISAFDQYLPENPRINRLSDSLRLWALLCSNKILQRSRLVVFLNKIDLLKKKLDDGVSVRKYITSYSNRTNDFFTAASYFRSHFERVHKKNDPSRRKPFVHYTSMLDTKAMVTQCVVSQVKEAMSRKYATGLTVLA